MASAPMAAPRKLRPERAVASLKGDLDASRALLWIGARNRLSDSIWSFRHLALASTEHPYQTGPGETELTMEILVFVKRVPATDSKIKVGADGKKIDPAGVEYVLNPYDEFAVEEALKTKEKFGGEVTVLTIGSADAQKELRTCLAMGADKAILLEADTSSVDASSISKCLAAKAKELGAQIIFCGKQAVDGDDAQVGVRVATLLGWACVSDVSSLELSDGAFVATRDIEGGKEKIEGKLPAVLTCQKGLNEPRYPNLKGIMAAKKKPLESSPASLESAALRVAGLTPPPARPAPAILGEGAAAVDLLIDKLKNEAKVI